MILAYLSLLLDFGASMVPIAVFASNVCVSKTMHRIAFSSRTEEGEGDNHSFVKSKSRYARSRSLVASFVREWPCALFRSGNAVMSQSLPSIRVCGV